MDIAGRRGGGGIVPRDDGAGLRLDPEFVGVVNAMVTEGAGSAVAVALVVEGGFALQGQTGRIASTNCDASLVVSNVI